MSSSIFGLVISFQTLPKYETGILPTKGNTVIVRYATRLRKNKNSLIWATFKEEEFIQTLNCTPKAIDKEWHVILWLFTDLQPSIVCETSNLTKADILLNLKLVKRNENCFNSSVVCFIVFRRCQTISVCIFARIGNVFEKFILSRFVSIGWFSIMCPKSKNIHRRKLSHRADRLWPMLIIIQ